MSEWRDDIEAVRTLGLPRFLYLRFAYRHHMRFIHKRGGHAMKHYGPMLPDGGEFDRCDWCGHIENIVPQRTPLMDFLMKSATVMAPHPNADEGERK